MSVTCSSHTAGGYTMTAYAVDGNVNRVAFTCAAHNRELPCKECDSAEIAAFAQADDYPVYAVPERNEVTTFGGAYLASITAYAVGPRQYTPTGGTWRLVSMTVVAPDGSQWRGRHSDNQQLVLLHRKK